MHSAVVVDFPGNLFKNYPKAFLKQSASSLVPEERFSEIRTVLRVLDVGMLNDVLNFGNYSLSI